VSNHSLELDDLRSRIDTLDCEIQQLINQRAALAQQVAKVKLATGGEPIFYRPEREAQVLLRVKERNQGPLSGEAIARLFREIMSACLALEQPMRIAFLGPAGTFTQAAAIKHFGHAVATLPIGAIDEIFREVEAGEADYGVVPVENSTEGVVNHTLDSLISSSLQICGEVELRIHHHLLSRVGNLASIRRIYSHRQTLAQCREWIHAHLPHAELIDVSSNGEAARRASQEDECGAIAGETAAELYALPILRRKIEDQPDNTTRFLVLGRQQVPPSGRDKTSLLISTRNRPGALYRLLEPLSRHGVSMSRIESRPSRQAMWDYVFFLDLEGHQEDNHVATALNELKAEASLFKILGSYPRAVL
jgi:chorismate mutase / prephenate dehydratase